jgi:outer membrane lipoprotein-sorting protein
VNRSTVALAFIAIILGCAGPKTLPEANPGMIIRSVEDHRDAVRTLEGSGRLAIETPEMAQSASFQVSIIKPDSLLVKVEGPFGLELGSALITRTSFTFYNSLQNQVLTGPTDAATLGRIFRVRLTFDDALTLFTGGAFLQEDQRTPDGLESDNDSYLLIFRNAQSTCRYWVDPEDLLITRAEQATPDGKPVAEQRFSDFRTVDGVTLPYRLRLTLQQEQRMVSIAYSSLTINHAVPPLTISVPANAERRAFP